ncbi:SGNH/GDSL hydrolase family protein [Mycoplasma phocoeninasale]|uniref:SGNH/GDSL hydrolase family protein n=1 Tax=Mycoplasma phocoeninasale TaxID=2726117 RepID=A0A858U5J5_9MOLU|nr:SGNH/GDSL hydrolase family protein [Mycoplasma phocoeninasale]QJG66523.1 SGNH/GDSL hydrolase family protein [Mycoplasma phocoeninasale]
MKKSKKIASRLTTLGTLIVLGSAGIIAASCTTTKTKKPIYERIVFDQSEVSGKIDYVALGDDYAAGNNYSDNNYALNDFDVDSQVVHGVSYASYFANAINELKDSKTNLRSYKNYGLSGSTIEQWLYILNPEKYRSTAIIEKNFEYNRNLANGTGSNRLQKTFGNFSDADYMRLRDDISRANLITLSVGYNDFFAGNDIFDILLEFNNIDSNISQLEEKLKEWVEKAEQISSFIYENYDRLITEIRRINQNANITLVGYTNPFLKLSSIIKNQFALNKDYIHEGIKILNNEIKAVAYSNNVNFVTYNNESEILSNPLEYSSNLFEMLPTIKGYKKLAQDLFMKLALGENEYNAIISDQVIEDADSKGYKKSIAFDVESNNVKSLILGNEGVNKRYDFEQQEENHKILETQDDSFNSKIFSVYKAQFNNGENMSSFELLEFFFRSLKILGIDLLEFREKFDQLEAQLESSEETRKTFIEFVNQVYESGTITSELKSFNKRTNDLIQNNSLQNITTKDIARIYYDEFSSADHIYNFYKEMSKTKFLQDSKINREFRMYIKPFFASLTNKYLYEAFFNLLNIKIDDKSVAQIDFELQLEAFTDSLINVAFDSPDQYGGYKNYTEFIGALLQRDKLEIKNLLDAFIKWLEEDPAFADKFINSVANSFIDIYKIEGDNQRVIREFVRIFFLNFNKLKNIEKLVSFVAESFTAVKHANSKTPNINELFSTFVDNMITDKYDAANENKLLFTLASANLGRNDAEKQAYQAGLEIISLSFIANEDFFDTKNENYYENNEKREKIFKLLTNLIKDKEKELTPDGKKFISNILGRLVEQAFLDENSDLNKTIKRLLDYFIVEPIIQNIKNNFNSNEKFGIESLEQFIRNIWNTLWSQIKNDASINGIKKLTSSILERAEHYDNESLYAFVVSVFKDGENNHLYDLIKILVSQLTATDGVFDNVFDTALQWFERETDYKFEDEVREKLSVYSKELLKNVPNSTLYEHIENKLKEVANSVNKTEQKNFNDFSKYISDEMNKFLTKDNKSIIPKLLDVFLARDKFNVYHIEFSKVMEVFSLVFKQEKIVDYFVKKIDLKGFLEVALSNIKFETPKTQEKWEKVLKELNKFIDKKYTEFILPTIKDSFKKIFSDTALISKSNSFTELVVNFIIGKKAELKAKTIEYVKELLGDNNGTNLKDNFSELFVSLADENSGGASWTEDQKKHTKEFMVKLLNSFTKFELTEKLVDIIFDNIETNIQKELFNFNRYNIKINLVDIFNGLKHQELINFIKTIKPEEIKDLSILALRNWEAILGSFTGSIGDKNTNDKKENIFDVYGELNINKETWIQLFKETFNRLDEAGKGAVNAELQAIFSKFHSNETVKRFIKFQLHRIRKQIVTDDPMFDKLSTKIFDDISNSLEDVLLSNIVSSISQELVNLEGKNINSIEDINNKIEGSLAKIKTNFIALIKKVLRDQIKDQKGSKQLSDLVFYLLNKKLKLDVTNVNAENVKLFISRILSSSLNSQIVDSLISNLVDKVFKIKFFDEEKILSKDKILSQAKNMINSIDYNSIISKENLAKLLSGIFENSDVNMTSEEIVSFYEYISNNWSKLKTLKQEENFNWELFNKFIKDFNKYAVRTINSFALGLKSDSKNKIKDSLSKAIIKIAKNHVKNLDNSKLQNKYADSNKIKEVIDLVLDYKESKKLVTDIISGISSDNPYEENSTLNDIIVKIATDSKEKLIDDINSIIIQLSKDEKALDIIIGEIFKYASLENTTEDDKALFKNIIKKVIPTIQKTNFYKKTVMERLFKIILDNVKSKGISSVGTWINDVLVEFSSIFSFADIGIFANLIGDENGINGSDLVKLINLFFGKSNLNNSLLYNNLKNINMNPNVAERTNLTTLNEIARGRKNIFEHKIVTDPNYVKVEFDPFEFLDKMFKLLAQEVTAESNKIHNYLTDYNVRHKQDAYKATYRFLVALKLAIFEMYGRETPDYERETSSLIYAGLYRSKISILWEIQEGTNLKWAYKKFSGMNTHFTTDFLRKEFTNYVQYIDWKYKYHYPKEERYTPDSIDYIIASSGYKDSEKDKLTPFKYKVTANGKEGQISKRDYILLTLKEGGFAKFMKINDVKSMSSWSGLDQVDFSKIDD